MGAEPWSYFVPYRDDIREAVAELQRRELAAGRYNMGYSDLGEPNGPAATIEDARRQAGATGTQSILDMEDVSQTPHEPFAEVPRYGTIAPLSRERLIELYGTERPTRAMVEQDVEIFEGLDRGLGAYVVVYRGEEPSELFFAGYSFD